jgi:hypothetical protein
METGMVGRGCPKWETTISYPHDANPQHGHHSTIISSPMSCSFDNSVDTDCMNTNRNNDSQEGYTSTDCFQKIEEGKVLQIEATDRFIVQHSE